MSDIRAITGTYENPPSYYREELRTCSECQKEMAEDEANYGQPESPICTQCYREAQDYNLHNEG